MRIARVETLRLAAWGFTVASLMAVAQGISVRASNMVIVRPADGEAGIRAALAHARAPGITPGLTIQLQPGVYRLTAPLTFGQGDAGSVDAPLRIVGAPGGPVILTGSAPLQSTSAPAELIKLVPAAARAHVKAFIIPPMMAAAFEQESTRSCKAAPRGSAIVLSQGERPLHLAQWPNAGYDRQSVVLPPSGPKIAPSFSVSKQKAALLSQEPALRAGGFWTTDWDYEAAAVSSVDANSGLVSLQPLVSTYHGNKVVRFKILNAFSELDSPGEYAVDPASRIILAWPLSSAAVEAAGIDSVIDVSGAHDVAFDGIALQGARNDALSVEHAESVSFANGFLGLVGRNGATISGSKGVVISRTLVSDTGESGIALQGGQRATLSPATNSATDNVIRHFGLLTRSYRPGVRMDGVGQQAIGNFIADAPHAAIIFQGNNHLISKNEIMDVVQETSDSSAIYTVQDLASRGTVIEQNYLHDIARSGDVDPSWAGDVRAIYLDGWTSGIVIRNNLFAAVPWPIMVNSGSYNKVSGNMFVGSAPYAIQVIDLGARFVGAGGVNARKSVSNLTAAMLGAYDLSAADPSLITGHPTQNVIGSNLIVGGRGIYFALLTGQPNSSAQVAGAQQTDMQSLWDTGAAGSSLIEYINFAHSHGFLEDVTAETLDRKKALANLRYLPLQN